MEKALYFMPDISGFTDFVNNTEVEHSIHIISELLEILLDNNTIHLKLVEVEGDALFMYTTDIPNYEELTQQMTTMHEAFHKHTQSYDSMRICNCGSCMTTTNLKLKFFVHFGGLNFITVRHIVKPYGSEVIKIHRLIKNTIPSNEYILFTNSIYELYRDDIGEDWNKKKEIHDLKSINFFYKNLETVNDTIKIENTFLDKQIEKPVVSIEKEFNANAQDIYTYLSELKYRHLWDKEIKSIEYDANKINRVGTEHNCVLNLGNLKFETISQPSSGSLNYGEKTKEMLFTKSFSYLIKLYKIDQDTTKVVLNIYITFSTVGAFMKNTILRKVSKMWKLKLAQLEELSKIKI
ncbi:DUF2652 domain-containing protein [Rasiella sp. SM2506]|uniref:DUF2652 domain-containing protein n=1 Tax=Rasiella sp. SM2506 TaxID=3423914 RepID=UPI003D7B9133